MSNAWFCSSYCCYPSFVESWDVFLQHTLPPPDTHTHTHLHLHTVERSCHYCCFICTCTITLISLFVSYSIPMHLILWAIWVEERQNAWVTSQRAAAHNERRFHISSSFFFACGRHTVYQHVNVMLRMHWPSNFLNGSKILTLLRQSVFFIASKNAACFMIKLQLHCKMFSSTKTNSTQYCFYNFV